MNDVSLGFFILHRRGLVFPAVLIEEGCGIQPRPVRRLGADVSSHASNYLWMLGPAFNRRSVGFQRGRLADLVRPICPELFEVRIRRKRGFARFFPILYLRILYLPIRREYSGNVLGIAVDGTGALPRLRLVNPLVVPAGDLQIVLTLNLVLKDKAIRGKFLDHSKNFV